MEKAYLSVVNNKAESISKPFRLVIESFKREKNYYYDIERSALIGGFFDAFLYEKSAY